MPLCEQVAATLVQIFTQSSPVTLIITSCVHPQACNLTPARACQSCQSTSASSWPKPRWNFSSHRAFAWRDLMPKSYFIQHASVSCVYCPRVRSFCVCTPRITSGILFVCQCGGSHTPRASCVPSKSALKASRRFWQKKEQTWSDNGQHVHAPWRKRSEPSSKPCVRRWPRFLPQRGSCCGVSFCSSSNIQTPKF